MHQEVAVCRFGCQQIRAACSVAVCNRVSMMSRANGSASSFPGAAVLQMNGSLHLPFNKITLSSAGLLGGALRRTFNFRLSTAELSLVVPALVLQHVGSTAVAAAIIALLFVCKIPVSAQQDAGEDADDVQVTMRTQPKCTVYHPTDCWYKTSNLDLKPHTPACMAGHKCSFNLKQRLRCPFWAAGGFSVEDRQACSTRFAEQLARPRPRCSDTCCTADPGPGRWRPDPVQQGHKVFEPDSGCRYFQYTRGEVLEYFQGSSLDILVVGDSFMRQLFVRLVHLLRGQERVVDYKIHTHASYAVCDAADAFQAAPAYTRKLASDKAKQSEQVGRFFLDALNVSDAMRWGACAKPPLQVHYMFGANFKQQVRNMARYARGGHNPDTRVDVIVSVMFWTHASRTPQEWLDALTALRARRFVRRVFLLGIPTARISPAHTAKGYPKAYRNRNRMMREWAANQTSGAHYIDFDALAFAPNLPAACEEDNKHYACHLRSLYGGQQEGVNYFREPHLDVPVGDFFSSEDGQCYDDMNAMLWQLYFNVAMKSDLEGEADGSQHSRPVKHKAHKHSSGAEAALEVAAGRFVSRVVMRGVT